MFDKTVDTVVHPTYCGVTPQLISIPLYYVVQGRYHALSRPAINMYHMCTAIQIPPGERDLDRADRASPASLGGRRIGNARFTWGRTSRRSAFQLRLIRASRTKLNDEIDRQRQQKEDILRTK